MPLLRCTRDTSRTILQNRAAIRITITVRGDQSLRGIRRILRKKSFGIVSLKREYKTRCECNVDMHRGLLTICSIRASSKGDKGGAVGGGEEEDGESPSALLILSGSAAIICSANVSTLASSSPIKRNHHPSQNSKKGVTGPPISHRSQHRGFFFFVFLFC